jgi:DivIVA domain-containing protein
LAVNGDEIRNTQFREKLRGYAPDEVDEALERLAELLDAGGEIQAADLPDVPALHFGTKLRGYHRDDVDAFFQRLRAEVR